jgi:hypothetical protein
MLLQTLVERAAPDAAQRIVVIEGSEHLVPFLGPLGERVGDPSGAAGPVLRIAAIGTSGVEDSVRAAAEGLGEHDVLVLALRAAPDRLPVGALVDTFVSCGLWVTEAAPSPARGVGCAFALTRDGSVPWRSYLLADAIPDTESSVLRLLAERAVEGLAMRAQGAALRGSDRARTLELDQLRKVLVDRDAELAGLRQALADRETDRANARLRLLVDLQEAELMRAADEVRRAQRAESEARGGHLKRAARLVRQDPVHGSSRVLRSLWRRTRAHGSADHGHPDGATSENGDSSV